MFWNHHHHVWSFWSFRGNQSSWKGSSIRPHGIMKFVLQWEYLIVRLLFGFFLILERERKGEREEH